MGFPLVVLMQYSLFIILYILCMTDWHDVKKIKIGLPIPHDPHSYEFIQWKVCYQISTVWHLFLMKYKHDWLIDTSRFEIYSIQTISCHYCKTKVKSLPRLTWWLFVSFVWNRFSIKKNWWTSTTNKTFVKNMLFWMKVMSRCIFFSTDCVACYICFLIFCRHYL